MSLLDGKVAVVTGGGRGLGRSHALALAAAGAAVVVNDVDLAGATVAAIASAGGRAAADDSDVSTLAGAEAVVRRAVDEFGRVDVVVNNAGVSRPCPIVELDDAALDLHLGVHLRGTVGTTRAAFPAMAAQGGGRIINTVSGHAFEPMAPGSAAYAAAKGAIFSFAGSCPGGRRARHPRERHRARGAHADVAGVPGRGPRSRRAARSGPRLTGGRVARVRGRRRRDRPGHPGGG